MSMADRPFDNPITVSLSPDHNVESMSDVHDRENDVANKSMMEFDGNTFFTIITCYHFGPSSAVDYDRLLRSLTSSLDQLGNRGRLILVANGTDDGAEKPEKVLSKIQSEHAGRVIPIALRENVRNVGGLNKGIQRALEFPACSQNEWIGSVQSSVVLNDGWFTAIENEVNQFQRTVDGAFGRLVDEKNPKRIWADGHKLSGWKTLNVSYDKTPESCDKSFPCLSAAIFRRAVVEAIVEKYGSFVFPELEHYGDCTDVALRARSVSKGLFQFCKEAVASKRWPTTLGRKALSSQIIAAGLYWKEKDALYKSVESLAKNDEIQYVNDPVLSAVRILLRSYSSTDVLPPEASLLTQ